MQKLRQRQPDAGYATDFIDVVRTGPARLQGARDPYRRQRWRSQCRRLCGCVRGGGAKARVKGSESASSKADDVLSDLATLIAGGQDLPTWIPVSRCWADWTRS